MFAIFVFGPFSLVKSCFFRGSRIAIFSRLRRATPQAKMFVFYLVKRSGMFKHSVLAVLALKIDKNRAPENPKSEISQIQRSDRDEQWGFLIKLALIYNYVVQCIVEKTQKVIYHGNIIHVVIVCCCCCCLFC